MTTQKQPFLLDSSPVTYLSDDVGLRPSVAELVRVAHRAWVVRDFLQRVGQRKVIPEAIGELGQALQQNERATCNRGGRAPLPLRAGVSLCVQWAASPLAGWPPNPILIGFQRNVQDMHL